MQTELLTARSIRVTVGGISDMSLWRWCRAGKFPKPLKVGGKNYWRADEVNAWLDERSAERDDREVA